MSVIHGDCLDVMAGMEPETFDAIVTDPPYGLEFMGKEWDRLGGGAKKSGKPGIGDRPTGWVSNVGWNGVRCRNCGYLPHGGSACKCDAPDWRASDDRMRLMGEWHGRWAEAAYRVAKPSAYLLAFGGTRTVHRMTVALEDAGWIIRDMLVWAYASGKSKASLKPAWEPIVMARKPGPLRMLAIDECRIPTDGERIGGGAAGTSGFASGYERGDLPKADRSDREPARGPRLRHEFIGGAYDDPTLCAVSGCADLRERHGRVNVHPTVKPTDLMRHLVRLVTPTGGVVLDPFLGSGTTGLAAEMEGFPWIGIERELEYVQIAEARLNGTQRGLGLETA